MTLQEQINDDLKHAITSRDERMKSYLRVVISEFNRVGKVLDDKAVTKELRRLEESAKIMGNDYEIEVLSNYLPKKMTEDETKIIVESIIHANNITSMKEVGKFMGILKLSPESALLDNVIVMRIFRETVS
jgi:uncharacterized protein YqeY